MSVTRGYCVVFKLKSADLELLKGFAEYLVDLGFSINAYGNSDAVKSLYLAEFTFDNKDEADDHELTLMTRLGDWKAGNDSFDLLSYVVIQGNVVGASVNRS